MNEMQQARLDEMRGQPVFDRSGEEIGSVEEIYYDEGSNRAEWIGIGTGFFGTKRVLVPVRGAGVHGDGIRVAYDKDQVKDSPDLDGDEISAETERELADYYRLDGTESARGDMTDGTQSVTRSEEELRVGKQQTEAGRVRLRKWVETEPISVDVELQREKAHVTREAVNEPMADEHAFEEQQIEVPLHAEEAVVQKETVAKERIGIEKNVETTTETVSDDLRKERVEINQDDREGGGR